MPTPISSSNAFSNPSALRQQREAVERLDRPESRERRDSASPVDVRFADDVVSNRQVESSVDSERSAFRNNDRIDQLEQLLAERRISQERDDDSLSRNAQRALQAFADSAPSVEERLGVEIVGVDTFA